MLGNTVVSAPNQEEHQDRIMKNLHLLKPIVFLDVETTGLSTSNDRIVELTVLKVDPDGREEERSVRLNPGIPIPSAATRVHGISDEDVADKPTFSRYANGLMSFLEGCDLGGFGIIRFDVPILQAEFRRAGLEFETEGRRVVDSLLIYHKYEPRDLASAFEKYCGKTFQEAHTSTADVRAAAEILDSQIAHYQELSPDVEQLHELCHPREPDWIDDEGKLILSDQGPALGFGKYSGRLLQDVARLDREYLEWICTADFSNQVRETVRAVLSPGAPDG